jgi:hypothetical protein
VILDIRKDRRHQGCISLDSYWQEREKGSWEGSVPFLYIEEEQPNKDEPSSTFKYVFKRETILPLSSVPFRK